MAELDGAFKETVVAAFRRFDREGTGLIRREKLAQVLELLGFVGYQEADIDTALGLNGWASSQIPYAEFIDWIVTPRKPGCRTSLSRCSTDIDSSERHQEEPPSLRALAAYHAPCVASASGTFLASASASGTVDGVGWVREDLREELQEAALRTRGNLENYCVSLRRAVHNAVASSCPKGHALELYHPQLRRAICAICRRQQALSSELLGCQRCEYDLCKACREQDKVERLEGATSKVLAWLAANPMAEEEEVEAQKQELEALAEEVLGSILRPLTVYFKRKYCQGELFDGPRYVASTDETLQAPVLEHRASGIRVWAEALDLRAEEDIQASKPFVVLFLYTDRSGFEMLTREDADAVTAFSSVADGRAHFGPGVYATSKEPEVFGSKEAVLVNNLWPRPGDANGAEQGRAAHLLAKGNPTGGPEDPRNRLVADAIVSDPSLRRLADYCVPMLVAECYAFNIWEQGPREQQCWAPGCNKWGEKQWSDRDIWVVQMALPSTINTLYDKARVGRKRAAWLAQTKGTKHQETLGCVSELAWVLRGLGEYDEAEELLRQELRASEDLLGPTDPDTLTSVDNLASLLKAKGVYDEAETLYRRAMEGSQRKLGPTHPDTLTSVNNLAGLLMAVGQLEEAENLYQYALKGSQDSLGPTHPDTLTSMCNLAGLMKARGNAAEAEELFRIALKGRETALGAAHPQTLRSAVDLASVVEEMGGEIEAESLYRRAYFAALGAYGPAHPETCSHHDALADYLDRWSRPSEAVGLRH